MNRYLLRFVPFLVILLMIAACDQKGTTTPASLSVTPTSSNVTMGTAPVTFKATLTNTSGEVSWTLAPNLGTLSSTTGLEISYTPPVSVTSATLVTLTASLGNLSTKAVILVGPPKKSGNLIVNGDAEMGTGSSDGSIVSDIPGWTREAGSTITVVQYGAQPGFPISASGPPEPAKPGINFFAGGPGDSDSMVRLNQEILLEQAWFDLVDQEKVEFQVQGYFGGFSEEDDFAALAIMFFDGAGKRLNFTEISGGFSNGLTGITKFEEKTGLLPSSTRRILVTLSASTLFGSTNNYNNGYADNLSITLEEVIEQ